MAWKSTSLTFRKLFLLLISFTSVTLSFSQTIFQPSDVPVSPLLNEGQAIETGVKFRASQNGYIRGIRYYKGAGSTGNRIGQLWSGTGTLLASAPFTNETASGWQEVLFNSPFAINGGTTYVAAVHSSSGDYAITTNYFLQPVVNGALRGLADGEDGPNAVFIFSNIPMFPVNSFQASNYWVDVVFSTDIGPDIYPPVITTFAPADGSTNNSVNNTVSVSFNESLDASSINSSTFELRNSSGNIVASTVSYSNANNTATLVPASPLINSVTYTAKIKGGPNGVRDIAGNTLATDFTWSFTMADLPFISPGEGYGGPILVLSSESNPFSRYATEILRAEGLTEFAAKDIATVNEPDLANYDVVILGEMNITSAQSTMLINWAQAGGILIAFRPAAPLSSSFGLTPMNATLSDKYLLINSTGLVNQTIQFHGQADLYNVNGATVLATLYSDATTATAYPAVTSINIGSNGGKAIAFTYDLSKSIVYTRQGNPLWAGQKRDGQPGPIRSDDLFFPDWIDFNKVAIPQADEQQRLLANIILQSTNQRKPLPRLWYLPRQLKAAIVMTGDDHANDGTTGRFNHYLSFGSNTPQDVADWNAVRGTSYIYPNTPITNAQAQVFQAQGFEIAMHSSTQCENFTATTLSNSITSQLAGFNSTFPGLTSPVSNRTHCMPWSDWATHAKIEANHGMRLDMNYYYWPGSWVQNRPGMFTGSGMPMRFADTDGTLIDCYQAATQMTDESGLTIGNFCDALLDKATGPEGYYGVFTANMHTDSANHNGSDAVIASARARKIPIVSAKQMLTWIDGRNNTRFGPISWSNNQLSFTITAPSGARNLNAMLPSHSGTSPLVSIKKNGVTIPFSVDIIKGIEYAFFDVTTGTDSYVAQYGAGTSVTLHPKSQTVCVGEEVTFTSSATGNPEPAVQWQESADGIGWTDINGATNDSLTFVTTIADNNKQYRARWTNANSSILTNTATLTVHALPILNSTLTPQGIISGNLFSYTPSSNTNGTAFKWSRAVVAGISNGAASGNGDINEVLVNTTQSVVQVVYVYQLTTGNCVNYQNVVVQVHPLPTGCNLSTSITANFNNTPIASGRYIWFSSVFKAGNIGNRTVNVTITNSKITYTVNNQLVTLNVPNGHIRFEPGASASTKFANGVWETKVAASTNVNVFMTGLSYRVPFSHPGGIRNVKWSMDVEIDEEGVSLDWKWTAGVYTNFTSHQGLNIKPTDGLLSILNPLLGIANAGTPLNYSLNITSGAMGSGLLNITNTFTPATRLYCSNNSSMIARMAGPEAPVSAKEVEIPEIMITNVRPNPATDHFNIIPGGRSDETATVRIYDLAGRIVERYEKVNGSATLRAGGSLKGGTYFAEIIVNGRKKVFKLIKLN